jgi:glycosyl transferase family 4
MFFPAAPQHVRSWTARRVMRETLAKADYVVVCSRFAAAEFERSSRVRIVPLGVDTELFRPDEGASLSRLGLRARSGWSQ